jgi:hypothetical protein
MPTINLYDYDEFSSQIGFSDELQSEAEAALPSPWGIARFIRREVRRKGLVTRRELRKAIEPFLHACDFEGDVSKIIRDVADRMVEVGEITELKVENQRGYSAMPSRWVRINSTDAVLLGTADIQTYPFSPIHPWQFLRRFRIRDSRRLIADLSDIGVEEQSFEGWIGEPGWNALVNGSNTPETLNGLLELFISKLEHEGSRLLISESNVRAICHHPGRFFGHPWSVGKSRWKSVSQLKDGIYVGAQPGYHERQWHPVLLSIEAGEGRSLTLNCRNSVKATYEMRNWLLIALSAQKGQSEVIDANEETNEIQVTFPAPSQIKNILQLVGESTGKWQHYSSPDWNRVVEQLLLKFPQIQCRQMT